MSERAREALRRLGGLPRCRGCSALLGRFDPAGECIDCRVERSQKQTARLERETARLEREMAVLATDRSSSRSYREACAAMVGEVVVRWRF